MLSWNESIFLVIAISRKFILLFCLYSKEDNIFGLMFLKSFSILIMLETSSWMMIVSSVYLK
jgi:hypothetical protein